MRFSNNPFISRALRKTIIHRSEFKSNCNKYRTEGNWANYQKQKSLDVNLLRKAETEHF